MKWVAAVLLVLSLGLHWAVLQTVAWTGMIVAYSAQVGVREGISRTFDGQHPCPLCKAIEKGRAEEREQSPKALKSGGKLDPALVWSPLELNFWQPSEPVTSGPVHFSRRADPPPKPRPRFFTA